MEWLVVNLVGQARRVLEGGRQYTVAPAVILRPGVLPGSRGPLFYPEEEIAKNPGVWNGVPLTLGHPKRNGQFVSAQTDGVQHYGFIRNDRWERGARRVDLWVDEKFAPEIATKLRNGERIEISTGLVTDNFPVQNRSHNGVPFTHIARNYRPDHLAILLEERGACSVADGCGTFATNALTQDKACKILKDGSVRGHPLTKAQRGLFAVKCKGQTRNADGSINEFAQRVTAAFKDAHPSEYDSATGRLLRACHLVDIFDTYVVYMEMDFGSTYNCGMDMPMAESPAMGDLYRHDFVDQGGVITFIGEPVEVERRVTYETVANTLEDFDMSMFKLNDQQRESIKGELAANANTPIGAGWRGMDLNQMSDDALVAHHRHFKNSQQASVGNSAVTYNSATGQFELNAPAQPLTGNCGGHTAPAVNATPTMQRPKSMQEALELFGTQQDKDVWNGAVTIHNQRKQELLNAILANVADEAARQAAFDLYKDFDVPKLQAVLATIPQPQQTANTQSLTAPSFLGISGPPTRQAPVTETPLRSPVYNFKKPGQPAASKN